MRLLVVFMALFSSLFASSLLTYNVYERSDRIDVMLSFDSPHEGSISQKNDASSITLTISDLSYDRLIEKSINSPIIQELTISPEGKSLKVVLKSDKRISVLASKTVDGFGLRIRGSLYQASTKATPSSEITSKPLETSASSDFIDLRYISVILVLLFLALVMLWVRKRLASGKLFKKGPKKEGKSWLFNPETGISKEVNVLHKRTLDPHNSVVLFEYGATKYLVMTGSTNVLLEKFHNGEVQDTNDFEKVFEENRRRLDDYLKLNDSKLNSYKNKASADYRSPLLDD